MKPRQRQAAILEYLQKQGKCSVEELAQYFDTTGTTIRKDLVILEHAGTVMFQNDQIFANGHSGTCRNRHSYLWRSGVE